MGIFIKGCWPGASRQGTIWKSLTWRGFQILLLPVSPPLSWESGCGELRAPWCLSPSPGLHGPLLPWLLPVLRLELPSLSWGLARSSCLSSLKSRCSPLASSPISAVVMAAGIVGSQLEERCSSALVFACDLSRAHPG